MKKIEIFERAIKEGGSLKDYGINATVFAAYKTLNTQETKTSILRIPSGIMTLQRSQRP